jgi:hypothetical protein
MSQDLRINQAQHAAGIAANIANPQFHQDHDNPLLARAKLLRVGFVEPAQEALPLVLVQVARLTQPAATLGAPLQQLPTSAEQRLP